MFVNYKLDQPMKKKRKCTPVTPPRTSHNLFDTCLPSPITPLSCVNGFVYPSPLFPFNRIPIMSDQTSSFIYNSQIRLSTFTCVDPVLSNDVDKVEGDDFLKNIFS